MTRPLIPVASVSCSGRSLDRPGAPPSVFEGGSWVSLSWSAAARRRFYPRQQTTQSHSSSQSPCHSDRSDPAFSFAQSLRAGLSSLCHPDRSDPAFSFAQSLRAGLSSLCHPDRSGPTFLLAPPSGASSLSSLCHPDRSGPIFSSAPPSGASGRAVEGSRQDLDLFAIDGTIPPNAPHPTLRGVPHGPVLHPWSLSCTLTLSNSFTLSLLPSSLQPAVSSPLFRSLN